MESLLADHGFTVVSGQKCAGTFGKGCAMTPAMRDFVESTASNGDMLYAVMAQGLFQKGGLEGPKGVKVETEDALEKLKEEMKRGLREEGGYIILFEYVARKAS